MSTVTHFFRLDPDSFRAITVGEQHAVVAQKSLGIEVGDQMVFREWRSVMTLSVETGSYSGHWLVRKVTHAAPGGPGTGVDADHQVLSMNNATENEWATLNLKRELSLAERQGVSSDRFWRIKERKEKLRRGSLADVLPNGEEPAAVEGA